MVLSKNTKGAIWSSICHVRVRGEADLVDRPLERACKACYDWYVQFVGVKLMTWDEYSTKYHAEPTFKVTIDMSLKITNGQVRPDFPLSNVGTKTNFWRYVIRPTLVLNERDLRHAIGKSYVPVNMKNGPTVMWS